jgi:FtsZ-binding cell division protein ZapB
MDVDLLKNENAQLKAENQKLKAKNNEQDKKLLQLQRDMEKIKALLAK